MSRDGINANPKVMAAELCAAIKADTPTATQIGQLGQSLLRRHSSLGLRPVVSSEEIVEAYYRCLLTGFIATRYSLDTFELPSCVNSSHKAVRRVCVGSKRAHAGLEDRAWEEGWAQMQLRNPEVNVKTPGRKSARRADLYVVANGHVVSIEFKYVGDRGVADQRGCASQMTRHAAAHAEAILVVYSCATDPGPQYMNDRVRQLVTAPNARAVCVAGPAMPAARPAA